MKCFQTLKIAEETSSEYDVVKKMPRVKLTNPQEQTISKLTLITL